MHRRARIVAPAYIGRNVKVQANALVTRCSNLERGCEVGYGTVVEDASILRDTCLGTGLDVTHAVVWGRNLINLRHDVALEINDPKLVSGPTDRPPAAAASRSTKLHRWSAMCQRPKLLQRQIFQKSI